MTGSIRRKEYEENSCFAAGAYYASMSGEADIDLEDYIASCAESLSGYETRDFSIEENETYTNRLSLSGAGDPVYIVRFTTGWNEDTRFWTVYAMETNGYVYLYAFNIWNEPRSISAQML